MKFSTRNILIFHIFRFVVKYDVEKIKKQQKSDQTMVRMILQDQDEFETLRRLDNTDESIQSHMINNTIVANNSEFFRNCSITV